MRKLKGFTLIEMLLVMLIVGLLTSLTAPRIGANLNSYEESSQRREIEDQIRQLPRRVRYLGKGLELPKDLVVSDLGDGGPALKLPAGWSIDFPVALQISPRGACSSSSLRLLRDDDKSGAANYDISEIGCELKRLPSPG